MVKLYKIAKRILDFCFAFVLLVLLSPLIFLVYIWILVTSGSPVVYRAERVGKNKRLFVAYKFRTLVRNAKELQQKKGYRMNPPDDRLIIPVGRVLRATHLDELPQLFNILKGDISFIGPRPLELDFYRRYVAKNRNWGRILKIKPGLTCVNQIARYSGGGMDKIRNLSGLKHLKRRKRITLDNYYIKNESFVLDTKITLWTIEYLIIGFFKNLFRKGEFL